MQHQGTTRQKWRFPLYPWVRHPQCFVPRVVFTSDTPVYNCLVNCVATGVPYLAFGIPLCGPWTMNVYGRTIKFERLCERCSVLPLKYNNGSHQILTDVGKSMVEVRYTLSWKWWKPETNTSTNVWPVLTIIRLRPRVQGTEKDEHYN